MESKKKDYQKLICSICKNKTNCNKTKMNIYVYQDKISIKCSEYKYEQNLI